jgi:hypothetical protein
MDSFRSSSVFDEFVSSQSMASCTGDQVSVLGKLDLRQLGIHVQLLPFCKDSSALSFSKPISTSWSRSLDDIFNGRGPGEALNKDGGERG